MNPLEVRKYQIEDKELQIRSEKNEAGQQVIIGYASLFNHRSKPITEIINNRSVTYYETIDARAMADASMEDVIYTIDHDPSKLIARKSAGNLELTVTDKGLMYRAILPNTTIANDLAENIRVGNLFENSFAFRVKEDKWSRDAGGILNRNILSIERIADVSTVLNGAYSDTTVVSRSLDESLFNDENVVLVDEIEKDSIDFEFDRIKASVL